MYQFDEGIFVMQSPSMNTTLEMLPGLEPEPPEAQVKRNLERAMQKYRGNIQAYVSKLVERTPEPCQADQATYLEALAVRRRGRME